MWNGFRPAAFTSKCCGTDQLKSIKFSIHVSWLITVLNMQTNLKQDQTRLINCRRICFRSTKCYYRHSRRDIRTAFWLRRLFVLIITRCRSNIWWTVLTSVFSNPSKLMDLNSSSCNWFQMIGMITDWMVIPINVNSAVKCLKYESWAYMVWLDPTQQSFGFNLVGQFCAID